MFKKLFDLSGLTLCHFLAQVSGRLVGAVCVPLTNCSAATVL